MLADDLVANGAPGSCTDIGCSVPVIARAQKFVLSAEFAAVADALSEDYTGLVRVFDRCRLPYHETWIEVAHAERPNFINAALQSPLFQVKPQRVGFLLQATRDDLSAWKAHMFWSMPGGVGCSAAALAMKYDMTSPLNDDKDVTPEEAEALRRDMQDVVPNVSDHPGWTAASTDVRVAMLQHTDPIMTDYPPPLPTADIPPERYEEFYHILAQLARSDWAGEAAYLMAVIGLLNARNATAVETVNYHKLNRARSKRGKHPLFEHKVLKIMQRRMTRPHGDNAGRGDYAPMRGHFVRGHFKARKSGVYFWSPHARGYLSHGYIEKEYHL